MQIITDQSQFFRWCQRLWSVLYSSTILGFFERTRVIVRLPIRFSKEHGSHGP